MDAELERAWDDVLAAWDESEPHKRFLALADAKGALAEAGKRYRAVKESDAERRAEAERRIDEILARAMAQMSRIEQREPTAAKRRVQWVAFGVSASLIAAALYQLVR